MDGRLVRSLRGLELIALLAFGTSCAPRTPVEALPAAEETLETAGKRLSGLHSTVELSARALRGDRVLAVLTAAERDALARGYLRFRIDRPAEIYVAVPRGSAPFWLADQGFEPAGMTLRDPETLWEVYLGTRAAGWVGLGVNALDRRSPAHYAVFLRAANGDPVAPRAIIPGDAWRIATAAEGASLAVDHARPIAGLPRALRGATLLRTFEDRRHATLLAAGRVWKTHVVSRPTPDQTTVAFGADPTRELTWSWRTSPEVERTVLRLREAGKTTVRVATGGSELIALREVLNDPVVRRHTVRVSGLEPDTTYEYALGDGAAPGMTAWTPARTAPRAGSDVALIYMGDPQCGLEGWGKLLASALRRRPDADALLIAGDLVDRGNERTNWDHFFLRAAGVFERLPLMPCAGNHEYLDRGPWLYRAFFALPANGPPGVAPDLVYQFEIGDAFIAVLDSTLAVSDASEAQKQADWLDEQLARTRRRWKLVMFHHPVHASHPWRESPALRDAWTPVFDRRHVDLVLQGHDHAYLRTYPLRAHRRVATPAEGTIYLISVSGDKYCDLNPRGCAETSFAGISTYQTIDILARSNRLVYRSFDILGRALDGFTIDKPAPIVAPQGLATRAGSERVGR